MVTSRLRRRLTAAAGLTAASLALTGCFGATVDGVFPGAAGGGGGDLPVPGVTDSTVKVGFIVTDLGTVSSSLGFTTPDQGDGEAQVKALVDAVNAQGGLGGKQIEPVVVVFEAADDSPEAEEALCKKLTQDEKVFAVVLTGQFQANARPCYAQAGTLMLDAALVPQDQQAYEELSPYLWAPSLPVYDDFTAGLLETLTTQPYLDDAQGATVGIVAVEDPSTRRQVENILEPGLQQAGVASVDSYWIKTETVNDINVGLGEAALGLKTKGTEHVIFMGGARMAPFFMLSAAANELISQYAISTWDSPTFMTGNPATVPQEGLPGSIGVGVAPGFDVETDQLAFPQPREQQCVDILSGAGITFADRGEARTALLYCDAVFFLKAGLDKATTTSASAFKEGVATLGEEFQSSMSFGTFFEADHYAGTSAFRVLAFDTACSCYTYTTEVAPLPDAAT